MTLIQTVVPKLTCRGCDRTLPLVDFPSDRSKPNGRHSRCLECKRATRAAARKERALAKELAKEVPAPPPPPPPPRVLDVAATVRRDALMELVKRHRMEFDDIISFYRTEHARANGWGRTAGWVGADKAVI